MTDDTPAIRPFRGAPPADARPVKRLENAARARLSRRDVLRFTTAAAASAGLGLLNVFPAAKQARADGYDILTSCPSYASDHNCSPGCGPSAVNSSACTSSGWHKSSNGYMLRPNQCASNTYDGWNWRYNGSCGGCSSYIEFRCHDGYSYALGSWHKTICKWTIACGGCC